MGPGNRRDRNLILYLNQGQADFMSPELPWLHELSLPLKDCIFPSQALIGEMKMPNENEA